MAPLILLAIVLQLPWRIIAADCADGTCPAVPAGECQDTQIWGNGIIGCVDRGFTEEDGCSKFGWTCKRYSQNWCKNGKALLGMEFALGARFNFPEKNCCACGKPPPASRAARESDVVPESTAGTTGKTAAAVAEPATAGTEMTVTAPPPTPDAPALSTAEASGTCEDTPNWTNLIPTCRADGFSAEQGCLPEGWTCTAYAAYWCQHGKVRQGHGWTLGKPFNEPEKHCCACGGGTRGKAKLLQASVVKPAEDKPEQAAAVQPTEAKSKEPSGVVQSDVLSTRASLCWSEASDTLPSNILPYASEGRDRAHGCVEGYGQCYWTSVDDAKVNCAAWAECEALYCTDKYNAGPYVCYARKGGGLISSQGDTTYQMTPCAECAMWSSRPDTFSPNVRTVNTAEHECLLAHGQCYWLTVKLAQKRCAEWVECESLLCSDKYNGGPYVCYARGVGAWQQSLGDMTFEKAPCKPVGMSAV